MTDFKGRVPSTNRYSDGGFWNCPCGETMSIIGYMDASTPTLLRCDGFWSPGKPLDHHYWSRPDGVWTQVEAGSAGVPF